MSKPIGRPPTDPVERFWAQVDQDGAVPPHASHLGACWEFTGTPSKAYGLYSVRRGQNVPAHIYAYTITVGPVPDGCELHHRCRNTRCIRPDHLAALTKPEHGAEHRPTHCKRGHEFTPANTYLWRGHRHCRACTNARARARRSTQT